MSSQTDFGLSLPCITRCRHVSLSRVLGFPRGLSFVACMRLRVLPELVIEGVVSSVVRKARYSRYYIIDHDKMSARLYRPRQSRSLIPICIPRAK